MAKSLERTIKDLYRDKQLDEHCGSCDGELDEGMMKNMAIDLKDMPADEFERKYRMSKAEAMKKFGAPEEVELDEVKYKYDGKVVKISKREFAKVNKDYKSTTRGKERMMVLDPKTQASVSAPVQFEEIELTEEPKMDHVLRVMAPTKNAKEGVAAIMKSFKVDEKKAMKLLDAAIKHVLGESIDEETLDELSIMTLNRYYKKALAAIHKSRKSHDASIMRGMDPSKDKATISKRAKGVNLAKSRALKKMRGEEVEIQEDGHEDIASAKNKVKIAMSALQKMQGELDKLGADADLPSWWMGKVAVAVDKIDGMADYLDTQVEEKTLTPAEKKKREEIAQAIQRDNPDMPMDKKMAIATATAKKVAEEDIKEVSTDKLGHYIRKASDATGHRKLPTHKVDNRYTGVARAQDKLAKSGKMGTTAQRVSKAKVGASEEVQIEPATNQSLFHNYIQKLVKGEV